jgi:hypothetical protein
MIFILSHLAFLFVISIARLLNSSLSPIPSSFGFLSASPVKLRKKNNKAYEEYKDDNLELVIGVLEKSLFLSSSVFAKSDTSFEIDNRSLFRLGVCLAAL